MRIDDRRDGVRGIVKAVDEFKAERDQQRHEQQQIRQKRRGSDAGLARHRNRGCRRQKQTDRQQAKKDESLARVEPAVERRPDRARDGPRPRLDRSVGHDFPLTRIRREYAGFTLHFYDRFGVVAMAGAAQ